MCRLAVFLAVTIATSGCSASAASCHSAPSPVTPSAAFRFIGTVEKNTVKAAVFMDGDGQPFVGREGEVIQGRSRLLRIDVGSVTISELDGNGIQRIPMSMEHR